MAKRSAGLLPYRRSNGLEVFLVHPGGPFWAKKDEGAWSVAKGEYPETEDPLTAARREMLEETGIVLDGDFVPLGEVKQTSGKIVTAWAVEADFDADQTQSNTFSLEWPPKSGTMREFPEVDRAAWFSLPDAGKKLLAAQTPFLERLAAKLDAPDA
jgi:predicted NUDIX family NTP pyrophosphohydrolase